jgi:hypothetical protein
MGQKIGWAPELVWMLWRKKKSFALAENETLTVQSMTL